MNRILRGSKRAGVKVGRQIQSKMDEFDRQRRKQNSIRKIRENNVRADLMMLPASGEQILFRVDNKINFSQIRDNSFNLIKELLKSGKHEHWSFPVPNNHPNVVHLAVEAKAQLIESLKETPELNHWYFQYIRSDGKAAGQPRLIRELKARSKHSAFSIYERVTHSPTSTFRTGASQGVQVHFWQSEELPSENESHVGDFETSRVIIAPIWNEHATVLPDPKYRREAFEAALKRAAKPLLWEVDFPIDAVYTWVDGADPFWQAQKASALNILDQDLYVNDAISDARFADHDELKYSLRSVEQFAPWIRKIWIVTAGQIPDWLDTSNPKIEIVSHSEIWPDPSGLPNFNSHAIESNLHRINGLSEHYLYFNDDFFLTRPLDPSTFFFGNGVSKVFFSKAMVDYDEISEFDNASSIAAKNARLELTSKGYKTFSRKFFHTPSPLNRKLITKAEEEFPEIFRRTRQAQFREPTDVAISGSFYFNYAMACGQAVPSQIKYDYIDPAVEDGKSRMDRLNAKRDKDCIVINDGSTKESDANRMRTAAFINSSLAKLLPAKSSFEL